MLAAKIQIRLYMRAARCVIFLTFTVLQTTRNTYTNSVDPDETAHKLIGSVLFTILSMIFTDISIFSSRRALIQRRKIPLQKLSA